MKNQWKELIKEIHQQEDSNLCTLKKQPSRPDIIRAIKLVQAILFPNFYQIETTEPEQMIQELSDILCEQVRLALRFNNEDCGRCESIANHFLMKLPQIKKLALTDIQAIYEGDPAAKSKAEVLIAYPGFYATLIYRIAHILYEENVPILARIMSEYAHEKTGIDINPGAQIGPYFCIDHGTGVVIGETCVIGHHVKLYQGVTLGARSFPLDEEGHPVKDIKRHPNIGDKVIIYANATVLGGDTFIGDGCVIGANVWISHSVNANQIIYVSPEYQTKN